MHEPDRTNIPALEGTAAAAAVAVSSDPDPRFSVDSDGVAIDALASSGSMLVGFSTDISVSAIFLMVTVPSIATPIIFLNAGSILVIP